MLPAHNSAQNARSCTAAAQLGHTSGACSRAIAVRRNLCAAARGGAPELEFWQPPHKGPELLVRLAGQGGALQLRVHLGAAGRGPGGQARVRQAHCQWEGAADWRMRCLHDRQGRRAGAQGQASRSMAWQGQGCERGACFSTQGAACIAGPLVCTQCKGGICAGAAGQLALRKVKPSTPQESQQQVQVVDAQRVCDDVEAAAGGMKTGCISMRAPRLQLAARCWQF